MATHNPGRCPGLLRSSPSGRPAILAVSSLPESPIPISGPKSRMFVKQVSPGFRRPAFRPPFPAFGSYPQRRMPMRPCKNHQIRVKIDQKGDVFRQKGIKKARISSCPSSHLGVSPPLALAPGPFLPSERAKKRVLEAQNGVRKSYPQTRPGTGNPPEAGRPGNREPETAGNRDSAKDK